jgi:hypothetical protein
MLSVSLLRVRELGILRGPVGHAVLQPGKAICAPDQDALGVGAKLEDTAGERVFIVVNCSPARLASAAASMAMYCSHTGLNIITDGHVL